MDTLTRTRSRLHLAALALAEEWSLPVFPCGQDKKPLTEHGFKDATLNLAQIDEWWFKWPHALIGVPTGAASNLIVVDVDPGGLPWYQQHADELLPGRVHRTPRGYHLLYRVPDGEPIPCSVGAIAHGIDVRGEGGFIIWWPADGMDAVGDLADIAEPPATLLEKLRNSKRTLNVPKLTIVNGTRNNSLTSLAGKMHRAGATLDEMQTALKVFNDHRCENPLSESEVSKIVESIARYAVPTIKASTLSYVTLANIKPHLSDSYVIKNLLASDSMAAIIGSSGSGKTFLAGSMAVHIARGEPWNGHRVRGGLVVYVALEGLRSAENRLYTMREAQKLGNLPLVVTSGPMNLRQPESVAGVLEMIRKAEQEFGMHCTALFIDTLSRAMAGGDENHAQDMAALVAGADALRVATGAAIVLVHHLGKDETRGARGHSLLRAAIDTELTVSAQGDVHVVKVTKQRDYAPGGTYAFRLSQVAVGIDADQEFVTTCVVTAENAVPTPTDTKVKGKNQEPFLAGLIEWRRANPDKPVISTFELAALAKAQDISRYRVRDLVAAFTRKKILVPSIGGHVLTLDP